MDSSSVVLITDANRVPGRSMALHLADRCVIGTYRSYEGEAAEVARLVAERGAKAAMIRFDLADTTSFDAFVDGVRDELAETFGQGALYGLVINAGIGFNTPFADTTEEAFDQIFAVQVRGPYFLTQRLLADGARVVFVSSGLARFTERGYSAYASTKGAIETAARYLALELSDRHIQVNVVAPGVTETDFAGGVMRDNPEVNARLAGAIALGRVGLPDDIGAAVAAALSDDLQWVTGQRIEVSGGQRL